MLGQVMKQARLKKGYTQEQLADLVNASRRSIINWELGRCYPNAYYIPQLSKVLGVAAERFFKNGL